MFAGCLINVVHWLTLVRINATKHFKGFIITSTKPGTGYPANFVGKFDTKPAKNLIHLCENAIAHK